MLCPCKDCPKKGCGKFHDICETYKQYTMWKKNVNQVERLDKKYSRFKKRLFNKGDYRSYGKANDVEKND